MIIEDRLTGPVEHHSRLVNIQGDVFIEWIFSFIRKLLSQQELVVINSRLPSSNSDVSNGKNCLTKGKDACIERINWRVCIT